jgi:hypothetical protein
MAGGLFGGIGAGIGVVVDASMVKWVTLYRAAEARRLTVKLAPRWSYGRSALFLSVSF